MAAGPVRKASRKVVNRAFFAEGETIFAEGDPSDHAYFIQQGAVLLSKLGDCGIAPQSTAREKQIFGEMALLEEATRGLTATAVVDTTCIVIHRQEFKFKIDDTDPLVSAVLRVLARSLEATDHIRSPEAITHREERD